jgi:hypothetical protein
MKKLSFLNIRLLLLIFLFCLSGLGITACAGETSDPFTFRPELFTKQEQSNPEECMLAISNIDVAFSIENPRDAKIRISGVMNKYCSNLQVSMNEPDIGKNIKVEISASTSSTAGLSDRPFEVELLSPSLRYGSYNLWINGEAMKIFTVQ